jgi:peptide-methionine (S)-S-oxide reductase
VVGYSGGQQLNPTYRQIKDHTEALLIEYDPLVLTYEDLLVEYARQNYAFSPSGKTQYRSALWYNDAEQQQIAQETVKSIEAGSQGKKVYIDVEPVTRFYRAEEYHQKFMSKRGGKF